MTRRRIAAAVLAALAFFAVAWRASLTAAADSARDEVMKVEEERNQALQKGDAAALDHVYSDDLIYSNVTGAMLTKAEHLADVRARKLVFREFKHEDVQLTMHGDTGFVTGVSKSVVEYQGNVSSSHRRFLNVFSKKDGRYQCVAHFETDIAEKH